MLVTLSINLFNADKITSFSEKEYDLSTYPKKHFDKELSINHFKKFIMKYELVWEDNKFSFNIDEKNNSAEFSYFTNKNSMEYHMIIRY